MDLSRVYTKTSKGILGANTKSRNFKRGHGQVLALIDGKSPISDLLEKNARLSENSLAKILDELVEFGMIRPLSGALALDDLGFSSTIIVGESDTQAYFEAQIHLERELRRAEDHEMRAKEQDRTTLLKEVKADIEAEAEAEAEAIKHKLAELNAREAQSKKQAQAKARHVSEEAEARAKVLEAEKKARAQAEKQAHATEKACEADEHKVSKEAEERARLGQAMEVKAHVRRALEAKIHTAEEAQRRADMEASMREIEKSKRRAGEETRALAKALDEARMATELETRVKRRVEARAREVEEIHQRAEAAALIKLEEESRLRQEAEVRAREAIAARQRAEEAQIKAEQDAQAQLEAERLVRKEAAARALVEAEVQHQAEQARLAAERCAEEAHKARAVAEARAKAAAAEACQRAEAEQRYIEEAKARAAEQARLAAEQAQLAAEQRAEVERIMREEAEREARAAIEARAKVEKEAQRHIEEERLRVEADALAVAEAEEAVRLETEAVKRQLEAQQRAEETVRQQEAERAVTEAAEAASRALKAERAEMKAHKRDEARKHAREAAVRAETEGALRRVKKAARREEAEETRLRTEAQARAMAAAQGEAVFPFLTARKRTRIRWDKKMIKPPLYGVIGLLAFVLAVLHLVPFDFYIPKLERQLTESLGQRVVVKDIRFSIYPAPHLKLEGVAIGDLADVRIGTARLFPAYSSWFSERKAMRRVELEALALSEDSVRAFTVWSQYQAKAAPLQFEQVIVNDAKLANRLLDLFVFDADIKMDQGRFVKAQVKSADQRITIDFTPQADALAIQLTAIRSVLPMEPRIHFDELKITAIARPGSMTLSQIEGQLYGGSLSGSAQLEWRKGWIFTSDLGVRQVAIEPVFSLFTRKMKAKGALEAKIRLTTKSAKLETLMVAPQVQATFRVRNGELSGVDLVRAIQSARNNGITGGKTYFNELSGYFQLADGRYQYRQLKLLTGVMSAHGNLEFSAERGLSGHLVSELQTRATALRTPFTLGGTLDTPTLKIANPPPRVAPVTVIQEAQ